jgi:hypothetical protein
MEGITEAASEVSFAIWNSQEEEMCVERLRHNTDIFLNVLWTASDTLIGPFMTDIPFFCHFPHFQENFTVVL